MSYDVGPGNHNYTYNLSPLFHFYLEGGIIGLNDLPCPVAAERLQGALVRLWGDYVKDPQAFHTKYDSPNGWGKVSGAVEFMVAILKSCLANPTKKVTVT